jgi:hypothetical protein
MILLEDVALTNKTGIQNSRFIVLLLLNRPTHHSSNNLLAEKYKRNKRWK